MVVFTCNNCGDSLQKPKVEKHYSTICNTFKNLTCVDCLKDFKGEDYGAHIKCVSEKERYAAKGAPITVVNKGEVKQQQWSDMVLKIINEKTDVTPSQKIVFDILSNYIINVPRKKMKFLNFIKNAGGNKIKYDDIESVWGLIEEYKGAQDKTKADDSITGEDSTKNNTKLKQGDETKSQKSKSLDEESSNAEVKSKKKKSKTDLDETLEQSSMKGAEISTIKKKKNNKRASSEANDQVQESNLEKEAVNSTEQGRSVSNGNSQEDLQKKKKKKKSIGETIYEENGNSGCLENSVKIETKVNEENGAEAKATGMESLHDRIIKLLNKKGNLSVAKLHKKVLKKYCLETGIEETPELIKGFNKLLKKIEGNETETKKRKSKSMDENSNAEANSKTDLSNLDKESSKKRKSENTTFDVSDNVAVVDIVPKKKKKNNKRLSNEANGEVQNSNLENETDMSVVNGNSKKDCEEKKSILEENGHGEADDSVTTGTESLNDGIIKLLKKKGNLSIGKLQKEVLKKYCKGTGAEETPKLVKRFNKLLRKIDCIEITNDNVRLLQV